jgi:copper(I)-binding protein
VPVNSDITFNKETNMKLFKEIAFAGALTLASLLTMPVADAHEIKLGTLEIIHPWARQSPMAADVTAGFMVIRNTGTEDDKLIKVTAEIAEVVQIHDMKMDNDVMKMFEIEGGLVIPAGQTVELKPKSKHIMFMKVKSQPVVDTMFKGTLTFEKAGTVEIEYEVTDPNAGMSQ